MMMKSNKELVINSSENPKHRFITLLLLSMLTSDPIEYTLATCIMMMKTYEKYPEWGRAFVSLFDYEEDDGIAERDILEMFPMMVVDD